MDLVRLFTYAWITIIPQCIPLAVLMASIMGFGNMAEHYELAAMKSSGLSLFKIMRATFGFVIILATLTFLFNNFILPVVHLKSTALLYDIRQKKPAVNIKEGIFYNAIDNYSIRVGKKSPKKDVLYDVYIYDHSAHRGNNIQMYSRSGKITTTADTSALVLILRDGNRYEDGADAADPSKKTLSQLNYKQLQVNIPLEDFKMKRTNEELFKNHGEMLTVWQIDSVIDSTKHLLRRRIENMTLQSRSTFYGRTSMLSQSKQSFPQVNIHRFYDSLKVDQFSMAIQNAMNISRTAAGNIENYILSMEGEQDHVRQFLMEWHKKIVVCFACIILFFVGAPLGAIIKKGGLGMPVIVSVFFFLAFYILTEMFNSLAIDEIMPPWQALWMPLVIFLPISIFLTVKAARDSAIFDITIYYTWAGKLFKKKTNV